MADGIATPSSPNRAAPVSGVALKGSRKSLVRTGRKESRSDRMVNTKSSDQRPNLTAQNPKFKGGNGTG